MSKPPLPAIKLVILRRLQLGRARSTDLQKAAGTGYSSIAKNISRLRSAGWDIASSMSETAGDPWYQLLAGPGHFAGSFTCPDCKEPVPIGQPLTHSISCSLAP